ncbi:MAG: hypothetical protein DMG83_12980 [Acidobacteria bacterium]|nr:MAG: hypothetical protein DMG83_12980 [Acidobacteriota bacterium]
MVARKETVPGTASLARHTGFPFGPFLNVQLPVAGDRNIYGARAIPELLGLLYFDTGETAARMAPQEPQFYFALRNAYAKPGRKQEAARARASFMRLQHGQGPESGPTAYGEAHNPDPARLGSSAPQP